MKFTIQPSKNPSLGIIGFGAFGKLIATHVARQFDVIVYDQKPCCAEDACRLGVRAGPLSDAASCDIVVLAPPVAAINAVVAAIADHCRPGALVIDVGSVKMKPAQVMLEKLPSDVHIVATHPLFGPQSAADGIAGLNVAVCKVRGRHHLSVAAFLRHGLKLNVILTDPEEHDRELAVVQGLTHFIARVFQQMEPLPTRMTTSSFELLTQAIAMVQDDAPEVFDAIENLNPHSQDIRLQFLHLARELHENLGAETR